VRFSARLGLLLDTTYILPVLGVEVEGVERVLEALQRLKRRREVERAREFLSEEGEETSAILLEEGFLREHA